MFKQARLSALLLLAATSGAFAAADGFLVGADAGWGNANYSSSQFPYMASGHVVSSGLSGGAFFGYQFNKYIATTFGYTHVHRVDVSDITMEPNTPGGLTTLSNGNIAVNVWDLALQGSIPFNYGFAASAKVGVAYVTANTGGGLTNKTLGTMYQDNSKYMPEAGVGASYDINDHVNTAITFTHIFKEGNIPNIDLGMINLAYHFG